MQNNCEGMLQTSFGLIMSLPRRVGVLTPQLIEYLLRPLVILTRVHIEKEILRSFEGRHFSEGHIARVYSLQKIARRMFIVKDGLLCCNQAGGDSVHGTKRLRTTV